MDEATSMVLMREIQENRTNRQLAQLYQGIAVRLHEAATLTGAMVPLEPGLAQAPEPSVLAGYANRLEAWLEPVRAVKAQEKAAQAQQEALDAERAKREADAELLRTARRPPEIKETPNGQGSHAPPAGRGPGKVAAGD
jgi:hypothetical protein